MTDTKRVLFLCTGNSVRSQMAEAILNHLGSPEWIATSAGLFPSYVHPLAIKAMDEIGIDISKQISKSMDQFLTDEFDYVITLCDYMATSCPVFPGQARRIHWSLEDPAGAIGTVEERMEVFRKVRDEIRQKIEDFLKSASSEDNSKN